MSASRQIGGGGKRERAGSHALRTLDAGSDASPVGEQAETWLARHPDGELPSEGDAAAEALELLADGWASTLLHALAARPLSTAELAERLGEADLEALEDRLDAMRRLGMLKRLPGKGGRGRHAVTEWLREGIGPIIAAARDERRRRVAEAAPIEALDVTAAFQLALPLLRLPAALHGVCALAVELDDGTAGVAARFEQGRAVACDPDPRPAADASCRGDVPGWFLAVIEGDIRQTETGGNHDLARAVLLGLHERLFGSGAVACD